jgi:uncharacterized protein (DUF1800 family)
MNRNKKIWSRGLFITVSCMLSTFVAWAQASSKPDAFAAARFLQQSSWGPTVATIAHVQDVGFEAYIDGQFRELPSVITVPAPDSSGRILMRPVQDQFFFNAVRGDDQLRQRVMFALNQIWVISGLKITDPSAMVTYLRVLQKDAFANYFDLMYDATLNPAMGRYLDMVNNDKPDPKTGKGANENYAREILQLFTIGLCELSPDGSLITDHYGTPFPNYTQETIEEFARAFTGWTYAPAAGATPRAHNPANWIAPMVPWEANHDVGAKTLLNGTVLRSNQSAGADLVGALDNIFQHPNVGPFICRQLIQHLVTSSPSPGYVERVANAFNGSSPTAARQGRGLPAGSHTVSRSLSRGDMKAVIKAILLDPEARAGDNGAPASEEGHLMEPVLFMTSILRALDATVSPANGLATIGSGLGQNLYYPPTVFNYFAPDYEISGTDINAPEFQILSTSTAMLRADFINSLIYGAITGVTIDLNPIIQLSTNASKNLDAAKMLDILNASLMWGRMPGAMSDTIRKAAVAATSVKAAVQAAIYLIGSSWQYQVQR